VELFVMSRKIRLLALVGVLACAGVAPAGDVFDLVPEDAAAALVVRNLNELKKKGDRFVDDAQLQSLPRPSKLFEMLVDAEGLRAGVDLDGSMAIVVANPDLLGETLFDDRGNYAFKGNVGALFVLVLPVGDADKLADCFGIAKGALKPDTPVEGKGKSFGTRFYRRGKYLFVGEDDKVVRAVATGPRAGAELTAGPRRQLGRADLLLYLRRKPVAGWWNSVVGRLHTDLLSRAPREDAATVRQLVDVLGSVRTSWLAARLDDGLGLSWVNTLPKDGAKSAREFLAGLARGAGPADLAGLPEGRVIAAQALRGDGARNASLARVAYASLWHYTFGNLGWLSAADRVNQIGVFTEVWKQLTGSRVALYQNADRPAHGLVSAVAILDTGDAGRFLRELRQLARFGGDGLDLSGKDGRNDDLAAVEALVRDLGDDSFQTRESATNKLTLIGGPALPHLEKALTSTDAEVRRRAALIKETIVATAVERRKEVLDKDALRHVHPVFAFQGQPESLDGWRVEVVRVRLEEKDAKVAAALRDVFGPDWDRIRLAVHGKQVVVLVGSDKKLLSATLSNLKEGKRGLADAKELATAGRNANPSRLAEVNISLELATALLSGADLSQPGAAGKRSVTSFGLAVDPDYLELDVWVPPSEAKFLEKAGMP
jgi:hypothetical protein